jgi:peptide/nickel transport system substrate-binding protein
VKERVAGQRIVLERNPHFWKVDKAGQRLPYLDRLVFIIVNDFNTIQAKFAAGEIDVMPRVRAEDYAHTKRLESPEIKVDEIGVSLDSSWLAFNQNTGANSATGRPFVEPWKLRLFGNQRFRQAISYAIDREGLAKTVYAGRAVPIYSFVTPGDRYWYSDDIMRYPHDPARAKTILAELGLRDGDGDSFVESEGKTVEIFIKTNSNSNQRIQSALFVSANLEEIGIKAIVDPVPFNTLLNTMGTTFNFDAIMSGWQTGVPPGPTNSKNILLSSGLQHVWFPQQKKPSTEWEAHIDKLVHLINSSIGAAERKRLYSEIQRIWSEQLPVIFLIAQREAVAYKNRFGNLRPSVLPPRITWNSEEIYVKR